MGYFANGFGKFHLDVPVQNLPKEVLNEVELVFAPSWDHNCLSLDFDGRYDEGEVFETLEKIYPHIQSGEIEFSGEDEFWMIRYNSEKKCFEKLRGKIVYELNVEEKK